MKSKLIVKPHSVLPGESVLEVWYGDQFLATVTGADGPGVRVVSKHEMQATQTPASVVAGVMVPGVTEVKITEGVAHWPPTNSKIDDHD